MILKVVIKMLRLIAHCFIVDAHDALRVGRKQSLILLLWRKLNYLESTDRINLGSSFRLNDFEMRSIVQSMDLEKKFFLTDRKQCVDCVNLKIYFTHAILVNTDSFKRNTVFWSE